MASGKSSPGGRGLGRSCSPPGQVPRFAPDDPSSTCYFIFANVIYANFPDIYPDTELISSSPAQFTRSSGY